MQTAVSFDPLLERYPRGKGLTAWNAQDRTLELTFHPLGGGHPSVTRHISWERLGTAGRAQLATLLAAEVQALAEAADRLVYRVNGPGLQNNPYKAALRDEDQGAEGGHYG